MFMKELKLKMTLAFNFTHGRKGTLWEGRFKSLVVAGEEAVRAVAAYIDLNCRKRLAGRLRNLQRAA